MLLSNTSITACVVGPRPASIVLQCTEWSGVSLELIKSPEIQLLDTSAQTAHAKILGFPQQDHYGRSWAPPLLASAGPSTLTGYSGLGAKYVVVRLCWSSHFRIMSLWWHGHWDNGHPAWPEAHSGTLKTNSLGITPPYRHGSTDQNSFGVTSMRAVELIVVIVRLQPAPFALALSGPHEEPPNHHARYVGGQPSTPSYSLFWRRWPWLGRMRSAVSSEYWRLSQR